MTFAFRALLLAVLACCAGSIPAAQPQTATAERFAHLPEANPYRAVGLRWAAIPDEDRAAIDEWMSADPTAADQAAPVLTPERFALAHSVAADLAAAATAGASSPALWPAKVDPEDPENPIKLLIPEVASLRDLSRLTVKVADSLPATEAIPLYAATVRFGRDVRHGPTLIQGLTGVAVEGIATAGSARRLNEFSAAELEQLSAAWRVLPAPPGIDHALQAERNVFFISIVERLILPGLLELEARGIDHLGAGDAGTAAPADDKTGAALQNLRLSGLINTGDEQRIHLENTVTGHGIVVTNTRPAEGIELIRFDARARRAWLRVHGEPAVLDVQSKRFVSGRADINRLRDFIAGFASDQTDGKLPSWINDALAHPDGPEGYVVDLVDEYDRRMARQLADSRLAKRPPAETPDQEEFPLLAITMPTIGIVARTFQGSDLQSSLLEAAIRHRLGQPARAPADPWSVAPDAETDAPPSAFFAEHTPDGGLIFRSRYETRPDEPYTYKFGSPDAGYQRPPRKP